MLDNENKQKRMKTKKIINLIRKLNSQLPDIGSDDISNNCFSYSTNGYYTIIKFGELILYCDDGVIHEIHSAKTDIEQLILKYLKDNS